MATPPTSAEIPFESKQKPVECNHHKQCVTFGPREVLEIDEYKNTIIIQQGVECERCKARFKIKILERLEDY